MKKRLLAFCILIFMVTGCGGSQTGSEDLNPSENPAAPSVSTITPSDGATDVAIDISVTVAFSKSMDRASVESVFGLSSDITIEGSFTWNDDTSMIFTSSSSLAYGTTYSVIIGKDAKAQDGNSLGVDFASSFVTIANSTPNPAPSPTTADTTAPAVTSVTPANEAVDVDITSTITIVFSEAMDRASVEGAFSLNGSSAVGGAFSWSDDVNLVFTPSTGLAYLTAYSVKIGTGAKDKAGNSLASEFNSNFTTCEDLSLILDGSGDSALLNNAIYPTNEELTSFTAEAWIYPTEISNMVIISDRVYSLQLLVEEITVLGSTYQYLSLWFTLWGAGDYQVEMNYSFSNVHLNEWSHVFAGFDVGTNSCYIGLNGQVALTTACFAGASFRTSPDFNFGVGNYNWDNEHEERWFFGKTDNVRISNIARYTTNFELKDPFNLDENTVALWNFDEPAGSTSFVDASGNGYTLTAFGNATTGY